MQPDGKTYHYGTMQATLDLLKAANIKFVGICQPGCDALQMDFLVRFSTVVERPACCVFFNHTNVLRHVAVAKHRQGYLTRANVCWMHMLYQPAP